MILGIVPARGGSKRVPGKNLQTVGGKSLIARAIESALAASLLDRCVVSSDDDAVLEVARQYGTHLALRRPAELATDTAPAIDYVRHTLATLETSSDPHVDVVVIIQPSSPFVTAADIDAVVRLLLESGADTAVSVVEVPHGFHAVKQKRWEGRRLLPFCEEEQGRLASHELPPLVVRNSALYATRRQVIDAGCVIGAHCVGYLMPPERSVDIDTPIDLAFARFLAERGHVETDSDRPNAT